MLIFLGSSIMVPRALGLLSDLNKENKDHGIIIGLKSGMATLGLTFTPRA